MTVTSAQSFRLTDDELQTYRRDGFVVVPNAVPAERIEELCTAVVRAAAKFDAAFPVELIACRDWQDPRLHAALTAFRARDRAAFGLFYDTLQTSSALQMVFATPAVVAAAAQALGDEPSGLTTSGLMLRVDVPEDTRNALVWHQDNAHYLQNADGDNGLVALVPMVDVSPENGMIVALPGSHREGIVKHEHPPQGREESLQLRVPQHVIDRYEERTMSARGGDLVLCHMDLVHRSGTNVSDGIRFTSGGRFHRALADDFLPGRIVYQPTVPVPPGRQLGG